MIYGASTSAKFFGIVIYICESRTACLIENIPGRFLNPSPVSLLN